ncbi:MAG TPA: hypothetical protein VGH15_11765, partial [Caulobacteraceae bacterium]
MAPLLIGLATGAAAQQVCTAPDFNNTVTCAISQSSEVVSFTGGTVAGATEFNGVNLAIFDTAPLLEAQGGGTTGILGFTLGSDGGSSGDGGGAAGFVAINSTGIVSADGPFAPAIQAFARGGAGAGGSNGTTGGGGDGGSGGNGGNILIVGSSGIGAGEAYSQGILAVSQGGGGGNGGDAGLTGSGGNGGVGGAGGTVTLTGSWNISTTFNLSEGIRAESLGAQAGNSGGGFLFTGAGTGGGASGGGAVTINFTAVPATGQTFAAGKIVTLGIGADGIFAQSVGGFSGSGGSGGFFVGSGGSAQSGGPGGTVTVNTIDPNGKGLISTAGSYATGILAQSVGGGGGSAGGAGAAGFVGGSLTGAEGASGGAGGDGGLVIVNNQMTITTLGDGSRAIMAQSVGGGGGSSGSGYTSEVIGGPAGSGGTAGAVTVNNAGAITTTGDIAA